MERRMFAIWAVVIFIGGVISLGSRNPSIEADCEDGKRYNIITLPSGSATTTLPNDNWYVCKNKELIPFDKIEEGLVI
jgi:hypothetical protein